MKTKEVKANDWKKLCEQITANSRGALVTIEETPANGSAANLVVEQSPLQRFELDDHTNACSNLLVIEAGLEKPLRHEIVEPIHILLKNRNGQDDRFNHLEIHSETGRTTITFSPGINAGLLQSSVK